MKRFTIKEQCEHNFFKNHLKLIQSTSPTTKNYAINLKAFISTHSKNAYKYLGAKDKKDKKLFFKSEFDALEQLKLCKKYNKFLKKVNDELNYLLSWNRGEGKKTHKGT